MPKKNIVEKPLSEIIGERIQYYSQLSIETLSLVYNSQNLTLIDNYESLVSKIHSLAEDGKLEKFLKKEGQKPESSQLSMEKKVRSGKKPKLTKESYQQAVKDGLTKEELASKYSFNPKSLGPMTRYYGSLKKSE